MSDDLENEKDKVQLRMMQKMRELGHENTAVRDDEENVSYAITPKGYMALVLMEEVDVSLDKASALAEKMERDIFLGGYIYLHETQIALESPRSQED